MPLPVDLSTRRAPSNPATHGAVELSARERDAAPGCRGGPWRGRAGGLSVHVVWRVGGRCAEGRRTRRVGQGREVMGESSSRGHVWPAGWRRRHHGRRISCALAGDYIVRTAGLGTEALLGRGRLQVRSTSTNSLAFFALESLQGSGRLTGYCVHAATPDRRGPVVNTHRVVSAGNLWEGCP